MMQIDEPDVTQLLVNGQAITTVDDVPEELPLAFTRELHDGEGVVVSDGDA